MLSIVLHTVGMMKCFVLQHKCHNVGAILYSHKPSIEMPDSLVVSASVVQRAA